MLFRSPPFSKTFITGVPEVRILQPRTRCEANDKIYVFNSRKKSFIESTKIYYNIFPRQVVSQEEDELVSKSRLQRWCIFKFWNVHRNKSWIIPSVDFSNYMVQISFNSGRVPYAMFYCFSLAKSARFLAIFYNVTKPFFIYPILFIGLHLQPLQR